MGREGIEFKSTSGIIEFLSFIKRNYFDFFKKFINIIYPYHYNFSTLILSQIELYYWFFYIKKKLYYWDSKKKKKLVVLKKVPTSSAWFSLLIFKNHNHLAPQAYEKAQLFIIKNKNKNCMKLVNNRIRVL